MITIRVGKYNIADTLLVAGVIDRGLSQSCYNYRAGMNYKICADCEKIISCKELQSAMHHMLAVNLAKQAENLTKENKTL